MKRVRWRGILLMVVLAGAGGAAAWRAARVQAATSLPTAAARRGEFSIIVRCRGELKARRSVQIAAPVSVSGLRIVWLAASGSVVQEGDPVIRFDPSSAKEQLAEKQAALKQAQAALDQAIAEGRLTAEQDTRILADASYQVERAKLDVSIAEIVSVLRAEESKIDLGIAEKKLSAQKAAAGSDDVSTEAKIASLTRKRDKAKDDVSLTVERLASMELEAPITGMVIYLSNYSQGWMNAKPFKVGDQVWPGGVLAEIPDLASLEMEGKIEEIDRGVIAVEQEARVRIDSLPEMPLPARLVQISPMTVMDFGWPPTRNFRGLARLTRIDPRLRPGMNGQMDVVVNRIPAAVSVPSKAVFTRHGKPIVYLAQAGRYEIREVKVLARNPDEVAVEGISEGGKVALVEPPQGGARQ